MVKKLPYIESEWSIASYTNDIQSQLSVIADRYVGVNPPSTFRVRAVSTENFQQGSDGSWILDLEKKLGHGPDGWAVICGTIMSEIEKPVDITISCLSPTQLFLNQESIFLSTFVDEINRNLSHTIEVKLTPGKNTMTLLCRRTAAGFGARLSLPQTTLLSPLPDRKGQAGWVWSDITKHEPRTAFDLNDPDYGGSIRWNPRASRESAGGITPQQRIFPDSNGYCMAWCRMDADDQAASHYLVIDSYGKNDVYLNGQLLQSCGKGHWEIPVPMVYHGDLFVKSSCEGESYGAVVKAEGCVLLPPDTMNGTDEVWVYAGCYEEETQLDWEEFRSLTHMPGGKRWYVDKEQLCLRTFFEGSYGDKYWVSQGGSAFGRWDYPLGVTLFGLLKTSVTLDRRDIKDYVNHHINTCIGLYASAVCDKTLNGSPAFDQNLVRMDCLDDCGSMGLAMLECHKLQPDDRYLECSVRIREFIVKNLPKLADGTFYRPSSNQHVTATIWADDLYMSTPFLRCLYDLTGDREVLELAADQFLHFSRYLFLPGPKIFSHVYDLDRQCATGIPWGRGNGWVLFSLAYVLDGLTERLEKQEELMELFLTLSDSYRKLQGDNGLWHQVLTDPTSYEEASCTAMFTYGFCKGIQNGWYGEKAPLYLAAARDGFKGLSEHCIDRNGSVHGVCKGSGFSFTGEYYKEDLFWVTNDNHGIGIILLAGNELMAAEEYLLSLHLGK